MATLSQVDPESFINEANSEPEHGRGAWTRVGIDFEYRYAMSPDPAMRIGKRADESLSHWAAAAGSYAIQIRLTSLGHMTAMAPEKRGVFGPKTRDAVKRFQSENTDPMTGARLTVDGIVGLSDARALFTPRIVALENKYDIPGHYLVGQTNHESVLDPGAVGYFIYYPDYRGVDRGMSQINSKSHPEVSWFQAFNVNYAIKWSAERLRTYFDDFKRNHPEQSDDVLWDAALCAHNSPVNGRKWAATGEAPTAQAANYVHGVKEAIYLGT